MASRRFVIRPRSLYSETMKGINMSHEPSSFDDRKRGASQQWRKVALAIIGWVVLQAASCQWFDFGYNPPPQNPNPGGFFAVLSQHCYPESQLLPDLSNADADQLISDLVTFYSPHWQLSEYTHDFPVTQNGIIQYCNGDDHGNPTVKSSMFTDFTAESADFLWFSGHGVSLNNQGQGVAVLADYNDSDNINLCTTDYNNSCFWQFDTHFPYRNGKLKWVFLTASFSVEPIPHFNWLPMFNQSSAGIYGVYGYSDEPDDVYGTQLADQFFSSAVSPANPESV